jgi:hypothetical protein
MNRIYNLLLMNKYIPFKVGDLIEMNKEFVKQANELSRQLEKVNEVMEEIGKIINKYHTERDMQTEVLIPANLLEILNNKKRIVKQSINWKALVFDTIKNYDSFFTTERIFLLNRVKYPNEFADKERTIRNIGSALRNLFLEGKILKFKNEFGKYSYGLKEVHFDENGEPKQEYIK